ncbi:MAG: hypothetical protein IGR76_05365 [Synechococcales cyanobacterium T60_A2020_003]|nr:hypothetical protein [Synechococcales cyanobacterium T60_A2020_003]
MSCPYNPFGQPACNIVAHPDRPGESFCASCSRRFHDSTPGYAPESQPSFWEFFIRVLVTVIIGALIVSGYPMVDMSLPFLSPNPSRGKR